MSIVGSAGPVIRDPVYMPGAMVRTRGMMRIEGATVPAGTVGRVERAFVTKIAVRLPIPKPNGKTGTLLAAIYRDSLELAK